jgi:hypothetical protein
MFTKRLRLIGLVCGCAFLSGCGGAAPTKPSSETKALAKLGDQSVSDVVVMAQAGQANSPETIAILDKVSAQGFTLKEKVQACRTIPGAVPAELELGIPPEIANLEEAFGPSGGMQRRKSEVALVELDFYTYGNLEVGMEGGKARVVKVNK